MAGNTMKQSTFLAQEINKQKNRKQNILYELTVQEAYFPGLF